MADRAQPDEGAEPGLEALCVEERDGFRVYLHAGWVPDYLEPSFDVHREASGVYLDFEELDRQMARSLAGYSKRPTRLGGVELSAKGPAAEALAQWLLGAMASAMRPSGGPGAPQTG